MHEMSYATAILDTLKELGTKEKIKNILLEVGKASNINSESLKFSWQACSYETIYKESELIIDEKPILFKCKNCNNEFESDDYWTLCPKCNQMNYKILDGDQFIIKSINIEKEG